MKTARILTVLAAVLTGAVFAGNVAAQSPGGVEQRGGLTKHAVGKDTRQWVDLQISGDAGTSPPHGMEGEVAEEVWQRYVDSFSRPIPEEFKRDSFSTQGR